MEFVGKKYKMTSSENFDEFMKAIGVGLITRKAANAVTPTVELKQEGDGYNLVTSSTFKTTEMKFKPGQEFDEDRADGAKVKSVCTFEGNTLKQVQKAADGSEVTYVREFGPEEMKARHRACGKCRRTCGKRRRTCGKRRRTCGKRRRRWALK